MRAVHSSHRFIGISAALFLGSAALTIAWCTAMSVHDGMLPMCSVRTVPTTAISGARDFFVMWLTMTVAMMLPSLMPMLWRYRQTVAATTRLDALTAVVGLGYFFVWAVFGLFVFAAESAAATLSSPAIPMATGAIVLIAGALQFTRWKARHLAGCRGGMRTCCENLPAEACSAWRHGLRLGAHCVHCCCGLTVVLLAVGMMDLRTMALVTAAISIERLAPNGLRAARCIGVILVASGAFLIARAMS